MACTRVQYMTVKDGSMLGIQLTTHVFVELPDDGFVRYETYSSHLNKLIGFSSFWGVGRHLHKVLSLIARSRAVDLAEP